jgi:hypothetical protein
MTVGVLTQRYSDFAFTHAEPWMRDERIVFANQSFVFSPPHTFSLLNTASGALSRFACSMV